MKIHPHRAEPRNALAALAFPALLAAFPATAQTWTGEGPDNNWTTAANWSTFAAPASGPTTEVTFPPTSPRTSPVVDLPWTVNRMAFSVNTYTLTGQPLTFAGSSPAILLTGAAFISNPVTLTAPTAITALGGQAVFTGGIAGPGSLSIFGNAGLVIRGANTFSGGLTASLAVVTLDGSMPGPVTVGLTGTLTGNGTIAGPVTVNGSGATLQPARTLNMGGLSMACCTTLRIAIDGPSRGTQYSTLNVTGTVGVSDAALDLTGGYVPQPGDVFIIIDNDGADPVTGTFAGLAEGATIIFNGVPLRISYVGGNGNDVTLAAAGALADSRPVPTLSESALVLLASLLLAIGMLHPKSSTSRSRG